MGSSHISHEKTLYVGGSFLKADGLTRKRIAAYSISTGKITNFTTAAPNSAFRAIAIDNNKVYAGGLFTRVGGINLSYVTAFDSATGNLDENFNVVLTARVTSLILGSDGLWMGGDFTKVNGTFQKGIARVDLDNGYLQKTDDVTYPVIAIAGYSTLIFIAGGGPGGKAAAFDRLTGKMKWEIASDGNFQTVDVEAGEYVYFGGHYEIIEGNGDIDRLTRHDKKTGKTDLNWLPTINGIRSINALDVTPDGLYIGGDFTKEDKKPHEGFSILPGLTK